MKLLLQMFIWTWTSHSIFDIILILTPGPRTPGLDRISLGRVLCSFSTLVHVVFVFIHIRTSQTDLTCGLQNKIGPFTMINANL